VGSGVGTNLKVGGRANGGQTSKYLVVELVGSTSTITVVVLASAYVIVSIVKSVSCLPFFNTRCPPPVLSQ